MRKQKLRNKKVARIILLNRRKEMLLVRQNTRQLWQFPGGIIGTREGPLQAGIRELKEETNISYKHITHIHTEVIPGSLEQEIIYCYTGTVRNPKALAPDGTEIDKLTWSLIEDVPKFDLTDTTKLLLSNIVVIGLFV